MQVKRYKKILTSKDNTLKKEEIKKYYNFCVPMHIQKDQNVMKTWDQKIMQCFEEQNLKDFTQEEAME